MDAQRIAICALIVVGLALFGVVVACSFGVPMEDAESLWWS